jgi:hypothetical protein
MSVKTLCCSSNIRFGAALIAIAALAACSGASAPESGVKASGPVPPKAESVASAPAASNGPYQIKAGSYEMKLPMNMKSTTYFEDYGKKTATYSEMNGKVMSIMLNNNDGFILTCMPMMKSCTKTAMTAASAPMPTSAPAVDKKGLEGMEVSGKKCEGWEVTAAGATAKAWNYKGIPCKSEAAGQVVETTMISEDAPAADKFAVPAGYAVK